MQGEHILKLLDVQDSRISIGDKWLVRWEPYDNKKFYTVYQRKKHQKCTRILITTEDEELACKILKGE